VKPKEVPLHSVAEIIMGQSPEGENYNGDGEGKPLITGSGQMGEKFPKSTQFSRIGAKISQLGDIIISIRASIGDLNWSDRDYYLGRGVAAVRTSRTLDSKYCWWALHHTRAALERCANGSTFKQVKTEDVRNLLIPLPPIEEQRRIAAILDKADALRQKRRTALQKLDSLTQSIFLDMFGDPVTNSKGWRLIPIEEIGTVVTGNTPSREHPEYFGDTIEWVKSDNLNTPHYYITRSAEGLSEIGRTVARTAPSSSILVTCIAGSPSCIGNAAMTDREVAFNQQINALIPKEGDPHFVYAEILLAKKRIQGASTNGMKGMVSKSRFEKILLPFPPIEMQQSFARRSLDLQKMQAMSSSSLDMFENLFDTLQNRAFRGEL
jgi:type I restriction enzyme S subunit